MDRSMDTSNAAVYDPLRLVLPGGLNAGWWCCVAVGK